MSALSGPIAGSVTIVLIVVLGIFVYPWLLKRRYGEWIVGLATLLLASLFTAFERGDSGSFAIALAATWALVPVVAALIVWRIGRK
ncbi:MAG: hypothetical protein H0V16_00980 [Burkholderiaceae bacterium]|nr:hypothetical protein [Burkholderiaceae bacterium]